MALYDALSQAILDPNQAVTIKVAGLQAPSAAGAGAGPTGGGGGAAAAGAGAPLQGGAMQPQGYGAGGASVVPQNQRLTKNPQLVAPSGSYTDAQFEAEQAQARHEYNTQYLNLLQQLGFVDDAGNFVPGQIETGAARSRFDLGEQLAQARRGVNEGSIRGGTVFSGRRAANIQRAEEPFVTQLARLEGDVPLKLNETYQQIQNLLGGFTTQIQTLLAQAAARRAEELRQKALADSLAAMAGSKMTGGSEYSGGNTGGREVAAQLFTMPEPVPLDPRYQIYPGQQATIPALREYLSTAGLPQARESEAGPTITPSWETPLEPSLDEWRNWELLSGW